MKRLLVTLVVIAVVVALGLAGLFWLYHPEGQRTALERRLSAAFGRPTTVGPLSMTLLPLGVEARDVKVQLDPSFGEGTLMTVDRVHADLGLWDYVASRTPVIETLTLEHPRFTFVKREDGVWNFATLGAAGQATAIAEARGGPMLAAVWLAADVVPAVATPRRIEASAAEVTLVDRTVSPAIETVYKGLALSTAVVRENASYTLDGRLTGDSGAAGGEPLVADMPFVVALTPPAAAGHWQAKGHVEGGALATRNFKLDAIKTDLALDAAQQLRFAPLSVGVYGGSFEGESSLDLSTPNNRFRTAGRAANVSLGDALAPHPDLGGRLQGRLDATIDVTGNLGDFTTTLASLGGGGHVTIADAQLTSMNLLADVAQQGGFERISFDEPGTHAGKIEADVRFENGRANFQSLRVENINDYASVGDSAGWIELKSPATIELTGSVTVLPALFEKVRQADPVAATVLNFARSAGQISLPLRVSGPISKPDVAVQWGSVLRLPRFGL
jgi:hypothetical protein